MNREGRPLFWRIKKKVAPLPSDKPMDPELAYNDSHPLMSQPDYVPEGKKVNLVLTPPDPEWVAIVQALCDSRP